MAKIDTYNLSTLLSFEYEAVLLSKNMAISIMMPLFPCYLYGFALE